MKRLLAISIPCALLALPRGQAGATESTATELHASIEPDDSDSRLQQLVSLQGGRFRPQGIQVSNGSYTFHYDKESLDSYVVSIGWSANLFDVLGKISIQEMLSGSRLTGQSNVGSGNLSQVQSLSMNLLGFDTRIVHAWDWFPWHVLVPFIEGGYQYTLYYQSGSSNLDSLQGGTGNFTAGAGLRFCLNREASLSHDHINRYATFPIFLTAKINRIFAASQDVNLTSTSFLAGLSVGL